MKLSRSDQLLVRACLVDSREAKNLFMEWERCIVWDHLDSGSSRLLPLLYQNIASTGILSPTFARLERVFSQSLLRGLTQEAAAMRTLSKFRSEGIPVVILKGFALRHQIYQVGNATRPIHDLDLLIRKYDFEIVHEVLESVRMTPEFIVNKNYNLSHRKEALFKGTLIDFDVHWRILEFTSAKDFNKILWDNTESLIIRGETLNVLNCEANLFHVIAHSVSWNSIKNLTWIIDSVKLIESKNLDWDKFAQLCESSGWQTPVLNRLAFLKSFTNFKVPQIQQYSPLFTLSSIQTSLMIEHMSTPSQLLRRIQRFFYAESLHSGNTEYLSNVKSWILFQIRTLFFLFITAVNRLIGKSS